MNPLDLFSLVSAVNNGWTFAAFAIVLAVWLWLHLRRKDSP
jgi:hypothetical protein